MKQFKVIEQLLLKNGELLCKKPAGRSMQKAHFHVKAIRFTRQASTYLTEESKKWQVKAFQNIAWQETI